MSIVYFMNNGEFDVKGMLTFGVSAKTDDSAIGYFGTGFKYAVAIILRLGGTIDVQTKGAFYHFEKRTEESRGQAFDIVYCNGKTANFTTDMGKNWEPWMAFRELYCNALDENGLVQIFEDSYDTIITVDCEEVSEAYRNRGDYILTSRKPKLIYEGLEVDMYEGSSPYLYYKGVAVKGLHKKSKYTYNFKNHVELTEDRTIKDLYTVEWTLQELWQKMTDKKILKEIVCDEDCYENNVGFDSFHGVSPEMKEVCKEVMFSSSETARSVGPTRPLNKTARSLIKTEINKSCDWPELSISNDQGKTLFQAQAELRDIQIDVEEYTIKVVEVDSSFWTYKGGKGKGSTIYLTKAFFDLTQRGRLSTLIAAYVECQETQESKQRGWCIDKLLTLNGVPLDEEEEDDVFPPF